jgi:hypothetical protein
MGEGLALAEANVALSYGPDVQHHRDLEKRSWR